MYTTRTINKILVASLFACVAASGCGDDRLGAELNSLDRTTKALTLGNLLEVNGEYGSSCVTHDNLDPWSIAGGGFTATNPALSVVHHNTACTLSITSLRFDDGGLGSLLAPASPMAMSGNYPLSGVALRKQPTDPISVFFNAKLSDPNFLTAFQVELVYSDDPGLTDGGSKSAQYKTESSSSSASTVPPPDYTIGYSAFVMNVDADNVVLSVSGSAQLSNGMQDGEEYVITSTDLGATPSFADVDADYVAAASKFALSGTSPTIAASRFALDGEDLTSGVQRNLIIKHVDSGATSYERLLITFNKP